ncbi:MAG: transcriptional repressor [Akkermansia sp.]|nr:transcriptional repressor [Akkermansia sp.]MBR5875495.1 transcriptional repressor [Akkermansia sp.]
MQKTSYLSSSCKRNVPSSFMMRCSRLRMTRQRRIVIDILLASEDHPTAAQIYERSRAVMPGISLATIYNSLEALVEAKLVNHLHPDNGPSRYCPNVVPHIHLMDDKTQRVIDVQLRDGLTPEDVFDLPEGVTIDTMEAYLHGAIPDKYFSEH